MSWTLTSGAYVIDESGLYYNSGISGASLTRWSDEAEGVIVATTRYDWVTNYASLPTSAKQILNETTAKLIANNVIKWDTSGFSSLADATTLLDINTDIITRNLEILRDQKYQEKLDA